MNCQTECSRVLETMTWAPDRARLTLACITEARHSDALKFLVAVSTYPTARGRIVHKLFVGCCFARSGFSMGHGDLARDRSYVDFAEPRDFHGTGSEAGAD